MGGFCLESLIEHITEIGISDKLTVGNHKRKPAVMEAITQFEGNEQGITDLNNCVSLRG